MSRPIVWASWAANASTDIYLIVIPVPMLWRSSLRMYKKIAATLVFSSGILVLVFATLKTAAVLVVCSPPASPHLYSHLIANQHPIQDPIDGAASSADWGIREAFVAVITTNLPMIFHLLRTWLRPIMGRALGTSRREYKTPSDLQTIGGGRVGGGSGGYLNRGRRGGHQPDSVTSNIRYSDDMERIVGSVKMNDMNTVTESEPETLPGDGILVSNKLEVNLESGSMSRRSSERPMAQNPVLNEW